MACASRSTSSSRLACARCTSRSDGQRLVDSTVISLLNPLSPHHSNVQDRTTILDDYYTTVCPKASRMLSNRKDYPEPYMQIGLLYKENMMEIRRSGSQPSGKGAADYFTGAVR